jgi:hypothetical protein
VWAIVDIEVIYVPIEPEAGFSLVHGHKIEITYSRLQPLGWCVWGQQNGSSNGMKPVPS